MIDFLFFLFTDSMIGMRRGPEFFSLYSLYKVYSLIEIERVIEAFIIEKSNISIRTGKKVVGNEIISWCLLGGLKFKTSMCGSH